MSSLELKDYQKFHSKSEFEKSLFSLKGIVQGINIDNEISPTEMSELMNWCILQRPYADKHPYNELIYLIEKSVADDVVTKEELDDILWVCNNFLTKNEYYNYISCSIQQLHGIIHGIMADNIITDNELKNLMKWVSLNSFLQGTYPFDEIEGLLTGILSDLVVTDYERKQLKLFFSDFIDTKTSLNINLPEIEALRSEIHIEGICAICPDIKIKNHVFCFTGESSKASRTEFHKIILSHGGTFSDTVTKETNYLVVGNEGNPCWAFSCYGRKVEKAVQMRKNGLPIIILHENDFWDAM